MADIVDAKTRSRMMSAVRSTNTIPERDIRKRIFALGFRYRLHRRDLPGRPDLVFPKYSAVILVHGCFWHQHGCTRSKLPATRRSWWRAKLEENACRDRTTIEKLKKLGWRVLVIWECSFRTSASERTKALDKVAVQAARFLLSDDRHAEIPSSLTL